MNCEQDTTARANSTPHVEKFHFNELSLAHSAMISVAKKEIRASTLKPVLVRYEFMNDTIAASSISSQPHAIVHCGLPLPRH